VFASICDRLACLEEYIRQMRCRLTDEPLILSSHPREQSNTVRSCICLLTAAKSSNPSNPIGFDVLRILGDSSLCSRPEMSVRIAADFEGQLRFRYLQDVSADRHHLRGNATELNIVWHR
jgi:hypothetical protein